MTTVTGEMAVMLGVLGRRQGDDRILDAISLVGPTMEVDEDDIDGEKSTYFLFKPAGTEMVFEDDVLEMIMVRTQPDDLDPSFGLYPRPAALVEGISPTATRAEVTAFLGAPERVGPSFDRFEANGRYLHFEYAANDRIAKISALLEAI